LKRAEGSERFEPVEVFTRDGWVCGICGGGVDPDLAWPDPMSASVDHKVPLSKGGSHTLGNAQCAHLSCNIKKSDSLVA
jgi:5-methylcytosine-specific restriction endonuclease McrA